MDAKTLFNIIQPHLETMDSSEKKSFNQLLNSSGNGRRRKILSLSRAKEKLHSFRRREMKREQDFTRAVKNNHSSY